MVGAAGNKQRDPHPLTVGDIAVFDIGVVHAFLPKFICRLLRSAAVAPIAAGDLLRGDAP